VTGVQTCALPICVRLGRGRVINRIGWTVQAGAIRKSDSGMHIGSPPVETANRHVLAKHKMLMPEAMGAESTVAAHLRLQIWNHGPTLPAYQGS